MMFVVRAMFHDPKLNQYKIVFITDRTDLEKQLAIRRALSATA
jgi:type I restriction enzyme R subunit